MERSAHRRVCRCSRSLSACRSDKGVAVRGRAHVRAARQRHERVREARATQVQPFPVKRHHAYA